MPGTTQTGQPKQSERPGTLKRAPTKAQRTFAETHHSAAEQYGEGERAHRTASAAVKHLLPREKREGRGETSGGIDFEGSGRQELCDQAGNAGVSGRSKMSKRELARAVARKG